MTANPDVTIRPTLQVRAYIDDATGQLSVWVRCDACDRGLTWELRAGGESGVDAWIARHECGGRRG